MQNAEQPKDRHKIILTEVDAPALACRPFLHERRTRRAGDSLRGAKTVKIAKDGLDGEKGHISDRRRRWRG